MARKQRITQSTVSKTVSVIKRKIIVFVCNWQSQEKKKPVDLTAKSYYTDVKFLRVMCASRIDRSLLLKCVQEKADGIFIGICNADRCHYQDGMELARTRFEKTIDLLDALGYERKRIFVYEDDGTPVNSLPVKLEEFTQTIEKMELYR